MRWTEGHNWVLENHPMREPHFQYKYVLMAADRPQTWELGENRLADLSLLQNLRLDDSYFGHGKAGTKVVEIMDQWQQVSLHFFLANPSGSRLAIAGMDGKLGTSQNPTRLRRTTCPHNIRSQVNTKYGEELPLGSIKIDLPAESLKLPLKIAY